MSAAPQAARTRSIPQQRPVGGARKRIGLVAAWASRRNGGVFEALVAHADKIKKQPEMIRRFLRATLRAMNFIRENRSDATQMITREFAMAPDIAALAYDKLVDLLSVNGKIRVEGYQLLIDIARAGQKIERPIAAAQLVDEKLLDEVIRESGIKR